MRGWFGLNLWSFVILTLNTISNNQLNRKLKLLYTQSVQFPISWQFICKLAEGKEAQGSCKKWELLSEEVQKTSRSEAKQWNAYCAGGAPVSISGLEYAKIDNWSTVMVP